MKGHLFTWIKCCCAVLFLLAFQPSSNYANTQQINATGASNNGGNESDDAAASVDPDEVSSILFGQEGLFRNFDPANEIIELRDRNTKHFRNEDGTMTAVVGAGDLHYWEDGVWKSILSYVLPNTTNIYQDYEFAAAHNLHKVYFSKNPGKPIVSELKNGIYKDWGHPEMIWLDDHANVLGKVSYNAASTGIPNNDSLTYTNIFPYTDAVILNAVTSKKLNYILKDPAILTNRPAGAVYLAFRESIIPPSGWKLTGTAADATLFADAPSGQLLQDMMFSDASGKQVVEIRSPVYYEKVQPALCGDETPIDSASHCEGSFWVKEHGAEYETYTLIPIHWLTQPDRTFPLIIDPITNYYPGGTWPTYTVYRSGNSGSWACATGSYGGRVYPNSDISYGWLDDTWPTSNPYLDGYATFDISALQDIACINAVQYYWYRYSGRGCGTDITLKFGEVQFNANLAEEPSCDITGQRIRNNNAYYNGMGKNGTGWQNQVGNTTDFGLALPGDRITLGWAYNGGDDCCSSLCSGDDGNYHNVYGYEHSTLKPYVQVDYDLASVAASSASASVDPTCPGQSTTLSITGGSLGTGASWNWYSGSCGGSAVGTGTSIAVSPAGTTTYYVRAEGTCNTTTCVTVTVNVTNTNSVAPTGASASVDPVCPSQSTTLSFTGGALGTGASWNWYSGSCGGTFEGSGASIVVTPASTTTYYVRAEGTCNNTSCASVTVTVNTPSTAPAGAAASVDPTCVGQSTTLTVSGGSLGTGASWNWYSGSCGGAYVGTGLSIVVAPVATTVYYVRAEGTCDSTACVSVIVNVTNTNSVAPTSAFASASPICLGQSSALNFSGGSLGTGATWNWYSGSCGGTFEGSGSSIVVNPVTTTTYYIRAEGTCDSTACASVTVILNTGSTVPASASASISPVCQGQFTTLSVVGGSLGTGAVWSWYTGSCGGIPVDTGASIVVSPALTTTYYVRGEGLCDSTACVNITVDVDSVPTANAGTGGSVCSLDFTFNAVPSMGTGTWTQVGAPPSIAVFTPNASTPTATATVTVYGTYTFRWTELNGACSDSGDVVVEFYEQPVANAGSDDVVCGALTYIFSALPSSGIGNWSLLSGPGTAVFNDGTSPGDTVTVLNTGAYTFVWTEANAVCSASDTVLITFTEQPVANAGNNDSTCSLSYVLNAQASSGLGTWTQQSGPGSTAFSNPNSPFSTATVSLSGSYSFLWTEVNGLCSDADAVNIVFEDQPVADAGPGGEICGLSFTMSANPSIGTGIWTKWFGIGSPVYSDATDPAATVTVPASGMYVFAWTETSGNCFDIDTLTLIFREPPVADAGSGGVVCSTSYQLAAIPSSGSGTWVQTAGPGTASFSPDPFTPVTTVSVLPFETGQYIFLWTEVNGPCVDSDTVSVTFFEQPVAQAGSGGTECDLDFTLSAVPSTGIGIWSQQMGPGTTTYSDVMSPTSLISVNVPGIYAYRWTEVNGPCMDFQDVIVVFSELPIADAGPDTSVSLGNSVMLNGQGGVTFNWVPDTFLNFANIPNPTVSPTVTTTYTLQVTDISGCSALDTIVVVVLEDYNFVIANVITPNGDGYNDTWFIDNIEFYADCEVAIYNRYGNLLYNKQGYMNGPEGWGGTYQGGVLPDGTYYYVITCPNRDEPFKGGVTIMKN